MADLYKLPSGTTVSGHAVPANVDGQSTVDVVSDYAWTVNDPQNASRESTPRIKMKEYQITAGQAQTGIYYWSRHIGKTLKSALEEGDDETSEITNNPYEGLYRADPTGFDYVLPYFDTYNHDVTNSWGDGTSAPIPESVTSSVEAGAAKLATNNKFKKTVNKFIGKSAAGMGIAKTLFASTGAEAAKTWGGSTDSSYSFSFDLLNTLDFRTVKKNWELCFLLGYQSMHWRRSLLLSYPPCIYEVEIPGVRHSPAAVISSLKVEDLGQKRFNNSNVQIEGDGYGRQYPEAYRVTVGIKELISESRNIYSAYYKENKVTSIMTSEQTGPTDFFSNLGQVFGDVNNFEAEANTANKEFMGPPEPQSE